MQVQFESVVEGNLIRIPERYVGHLPSTVKVILSPTSESNIRYAPNAGMGELSLEDFKAIGIDTRNFHHVVLVLFKYPTGSK